MVALEIIRLTGGERIIRLALLDTSPYPPTEAKKEKFWKYLAECAGGRFREIIQKFST